MAGVTNVYYVSDQSYFETIVSGSFNQITNKYDSLEVLTYEEADFIESQLRFSTYFNHKFSPKHTLRIGGIMSRLAFNLTNTFWNRDQGQLVTPLDENDHAGFYQAFGNWQFRTSDKFTLNTGLHFSHFALKGRSYLEPRMGFKWNQGTYQLSGGIGFHSRMETVALYTARQYRENGSFVQNNKDLGFTQAFHSAL